MFNNFSEEARKIIILAKNEMSELNHPYVSSEHLLLAILKSNNDISKRLKNYNITYDNFKKEIIKIIGIGKKKSEWVLYTPMFKAILEKAILISGDDDCVTIDNLFEALLDEGEGVAVRILLSMNINLDTLYNDFSSHPVKRGKKKKSILDDIGIELTSINNNLDPVVGREKEIKRIMEILTRRTKNNPLLIGEAGVGKTAIVEELSRLIKENDVPQKLINKRIISIDMSSLVAGTKYRGEFEEKINKIIKEVENDSNIILFIDEIHTLVGAGGAEGAIDAANIFKPALARGKIKVIGATTLVEYKKFMESDKALDRRFQTVMIEEPSKDTIKKIIETLRPIYEDYHKVIIPDKIVERIIDLSSKYLKTRKEPDRTIDILDEVCSHTNIKENKNLANFNRLNKQLYNVIKLKKDAIINDNYDMAAKYKEEEYVLMTTINNLEIKLAKTIRHEITNKDLEEVIASKVNIPIYKLNNKFNKDKVLKELKKDIIGQDDVLNYFLNNFKNNITNNNCLAYLFIGKTGVGKTLSATKLASCLNYHLLKLDMSEYQEVHTISKLIGTTAGYTGYNDIAILDSINDYPFTLLVLDEIDKCHESILNLFYTAIDNNVIKNSKGENIYFNNTIIIMTSCYNDSNIVGFNKLEGKNRYTNSFSKSLLNRVNIIEFNDLNKDSIIKIINKMTSKKKFKAKDKEKILSLTDYKNNGAREIPYIIKDLENGFAKVS